MLLEVEGLCVNYGHIEAIRDISFGVEEGTVVTLIGANGAGKSTTLKTISGLRKVRAGTVRFEGKDITDVPGHERVLLGISQSPEGRGIFPGMTVRENLDMGAYTRKDRKTAAYQEDLGRVFALFPRLEERISQVAGTMSGGEQQMLAIGRALMSEPKYLLLDEPSLGLAPRIVEQIRDLIVEINRDGVGVLLIEQNAAMALSVADHGYVLENGRTVMDAPAAQLRDDETIQEFYLGVGGSSGSLRDVKHYAKKKRWLS